MFLSELLVALAMALLLSLILFGVGWEPSYQEGARGGLLAWFVILLLAVWVGGIWLPPFGPRFRDIAWLPFLLIGVCVLLLLLVAVPVSRPWRRPRSRLEALEQVDQAREEEAVRASAFGCLFWLLIVLMIIALLSRYTIYPRPIALPTAAGLEQGVETAADATDPSQNEKILPF